MKNTLLLPQGDNVDNTTYQRIKGKYDRLSDKARKVLNDAEKLRLVSDIAFKFRPTDAPYFPLMRFGKYWVKKDDNALIFSFCSASNGYS